ncbi:hypothetical protein ACFZA2_10225 [Microbacterium sp. NPDC007973]|uniref:hypothetical protein n=1 Tax=Microbacterium sp. NPDC007973 TaxID=3364182 RepID=UPI0036EE6810
MSLFESSSKGVKFDAVGATVTGVVQSAPRERQQTKFGTQEPDFWPNGDPKMQILVDLKTDQRVDASDDGERTLYVASKNMKRAIGEAIRAAGASDIAPGGTLTVQYLGNDPASKNPANPAKMYAATYTAPTSAFAQQPAAAAAAPVAAPQQPVAAQPAPAQQQYVQPVAPAAVAQPQAPVQQSVAVPAPHPSGLTDQQVSQVQQLRGAGIPDAQIAAAINATQQQLDLVAS